MCRLGDSLRLEKRDKVEKRTKIGVVIYKISTQEFQVVAVEVFDVDWESYTMTIGFGGILPELYVDGKWLIR